jgi:hypothetical protein
MTYFHATVLLAAADIDDVRVSVHDDDEGRWPAVLLSDQLTLMPRPGENLAGVLRLLADHIDAAMTLNVGAVAS